MQHIRAVMRMSDDASGDGGIFVFVLRPPLERLRCVPTTKL